VSGFLVDPDDVQALGASVRAAAEHAGAAVGRVRAEADALFATGWRGPAAAAFRSGWNDWLDGAEDVLAALDELATLLGASAADYRQSDEAVRAGVARVAAEAGTAE
jgi:WXG100 family type VII secretion target